MKSDAGLPLPRAGKSDDGAVILEITDINPAAGGATTYVAGTPATVIIQAPCGISNLNCDFLSGPYDCFWTGSCGMFPLNERFARTSGCHPESPNNAAVGHVCDENVVN